jgi:hypothetical protein
MMTPVALIVTTFLMPQPASAITMLVAATWSSAPARLSVAASQPLQKPRPAAVATAAQWFARKEALIWLAM